MTNTRQLPDAVDVAQASELTGLSKKAIRRRMERGTLESVKVGGKRLILVSELDRHELLGDDGGGAGSAAEPPSPEPATESVPEAVSAPADDRASAPVAEPSSPPERPDYAASPGYPTGRITPETAPSGATSEPGAQPVQPQPPAAAPPVQPQPAAVTPPVQPQMPVAPPPAQPAPVAPAGTYVPAEPYYAPGPPFAGGVAYYWSEYRSLRILALILLVAVVALLVWLLAIRDSGGEATAVRPGGGPVAVTQQDLVALSERLHQPIYWAGNRSGTHMELSETSNSYAYLRYLTQDAPIGDTSASYLTVGTYPQTDAYRNLRDYARHSHAQTERIANGGIAVTVPGSPTSVYFAYPHQNVQVEVYDPQSGRALELVKSEAVTPVTAVTTTTGSGVAPTTPAVPTTPSETPAIPPQG